LYEYIYKAYGYWRVVVEGLKIHTAAYT